MALLAQTSDSPGAGLIIAGIIFAVIALALAAFVVAALVSIVRSPSYTPALKALWVLGIIAVPLIGAVLWFAIGRKGPGRDYSLGA